MPSIFEATAGKLIGPTNGGSVTQATNKSTAVTLNTESGVITTNNAALADAAEVTFVPKMPFMADTFENCPGLGRIAVMNSNSLVMLGKIIEIEYKKE